MAQVRSGDRVQIHYTGRLEDGTVFGTSEGKPPVRFTVGSGQMLEAVNSAVLGMQPGDRTTLTLSPEGGFGQRRPELEQRVPRASLPADVRVGDRLLARQGEQQAPVWVRELGEGFAVVDGNHPLAGQTVAMDIELVAVESPA